MASSEREAVSIVIEGATASQLQSLLPELSRLSLRATFAVSGQMVVQDFVHWKEAYQQGHELANASLHGYSIDGELPNWTIRTVEQDLHMTQQYLEDEFGDGAKTFILPGLSTKCGDGEYMGVVRVAFDYVVGLQVGVNLPPVAVKNLLSLEGIAWLEALEQPTEGWSILRLPAAMPHFLLEKLAHSGIPVAPVAEVASSVLSPESVR